MLEYYTKKGVSLRSQLQDMSLRSDQNLIKEGKNNSLIQQYYFEGGEQMKAESQFFEDFG